jgi:hypothetical protein
MSDELIVKCDLCGENIAKTSEEAVSYPMTGAMFRSPDSEHGLPDPFDTALSWEDFRCPYGRTHRPFISRDILSTNLGNYRVAKDGNPGGFVENRTEIDREAVIDRTVVPTDEQAEAIVRADMSAKTPEKSDEKPPENVSHETEKIRCDICGRMIGKPGYISHRKSHKEI